MKGRGVEQSVRYEHLQHDIDEKHDQLLSFLNIKRLGDFMQAEPFDPTQRQNVST